MFLGLMFQGFSRALSSIKEQPAGKGGHIQQVYSLSSWGADHLPPWRASSYPQAANIILIPCICE